MTATLILRIHSNDTNLIRKFVRILVMVSLRGYFLFVLRGFLALAEEFKAAFLDNLALNFSTRPAASTSFSLPVYRGWQALQISVSIVSLVEPIVKVLPQAHFTLALGKYVGWISGFILI